MTDGEMYKSLDTRITNLEKQHSDLQLSYARLASDVGKAEDKASSAWKRINEVSESIKQIDERLDKLEQTVLQMANSTRYAIDSLKKACVIFGCCAVVALVYSIVQDKVTADSILNAVANGAKVLV